MNNKQLEHVRYRTAQINKDILATHPEAKEEKQNASARIARAMLAGRKLELRPVREIVSKVGRYNHCEDYAGVIELEDVFVAPPIVKNVDAEKAAKARAALTAKLEAKREELISRCVDEEFDSTTKALAAYERETAQFRKLA